ncbi:MAG TPA: thermonuclease family protein [Edaphocola sp.]|nr:thermonuclease family protein [Edaphocola sp.]
MKFFYCLIFLLIIHPFYSTAQKIAYEKVSKKYSPFLIGSVQKGKSIKVDDGDTFVFLSKSNRKFAIRIDGIDAPEKGMSYARRSKQYLAELLKDKEISVRILDIDQYGRYVGRIIVERHDVSELMIASGYAWQYRKYNKDSILRNLETKARNQKSGLWKEANPLAPWVVRAYRRAGYSDKEFRRLREANSPLIKKFLEKQ